MRFDMPKCEKNAELYVLVYRNECPVRLVLCFAVLFSTGKHSHDSLCMYNIPDMAAKYGVDYSSFV